MDNLFNMISKGSSYFIPESITATVNNMQGKIIDVKFALDSEKQAADTAKLFQASGAEVTVVGKELAVKGDMGRIMKTSLEDADLMFHNNGVSTCCQVRLCRKAGAVQLVDSIYSQWVRT